MTLFTSALAQKSETRAFADQAIGQYALIVSDILSLLLAGVLANVVHWLYLGAPPDEFLRIWTGEMGEVRVTLFAVLVGVGSVWFWLLGHYTKRRPFWDEVAEVARVLTILAVLDAALLYLAKLQFSRFWFVWIWFFALGLIPFLRLLCKRVLTNVGVWQRPAVILGTGPNAIEAIEALHSEPLMGFQVVAFAEPRKDDDISKSHIDVQGQRFPVVPLGNELVSELKLRTNGKPTVVVALEHEDLSREANLIARLHRIADDIRVVPPVRGLPLFGATVHHFFRHELFFLSLNNNLARRAPRAVKRVFDLVVSATLLLLLAPIFAYLSWVIRKDGGPVYFAHQRIGHNGKPFRCLKFRTMVPNAQAVLQQLLDSDPVARAEWERDFKLKNDPRITAVGRFLREYSLDELPQLWNVLKGEMSLVGPRPIIQEELKRYDEFADYYLEASPGMTGLWQISGRNNTDYCYRVYLDSWYAKNWSLWYDIVILIKTIGVVAAREGAY